MALSFTQASAGNNSGESWRLRLSRGDPVEILSASAGGWVQGIIIGISPDRIKVEYQESGDRCDKTLLRSSLKLQLPRGPVNAVAGVPVTPVTATRAEDQAVATRAEGNDRVEGQRRWALERPASQLAQPSPGQPTGLRKSGPGIAVSPVASPGGRGPGLVATPGVPSSQNPAEKCLSFSAREWLRLSELHFGEPLGSGGFGTVYRGNLHGENVAIKQLHPSEGGQMTAEQLTEFQKEVANLQALRHPRLVRFIGVAVEPPVVCIVTELAVGGSLFSLLHAQRVQVSDARRRMIVLEIVEGVAFLHSRRPPCVHRDLKSANVVLDSELSAKLCDFGLAEPMEKTHISRRETEGGSPRYMAPEAFDSRCRITEKVDIWALGCLAIEVLLVRVPHEDCSTLQQVAAKLLVREEGPFSSDWANSLHSGVKPLLEPCFARNEAMRPSAAALLEGLGRIEGLSAP